MRSLFLALLLVFSLLPAAGAVADPMPTVDQDDRPSFSVINGVPADPGEYPAMAALINDNFGGQFCGGTLIDAEWVLTAAHCFFDPRTGEQDSQPADLMVALNTVDWRTGGERLGVVQIVVHPDYDAITSANDIALMQLSSPAQTPPGAVPVAGQTELYQPGRPAIVTGYGATTPFGENPSPILLEAAVPLVSDASCQQGYPTLVGDRMVCAGDPGTEAAPGNDTCQGDSGGPLWTDSGDGVLAVVGVTSFGGLCGVENPGVYTEVLTYVDWLAGIIDGTIGPGDPDPTTPEPPVGGPQRIVFDDSGASDPVTQAVAISRGAFRDGEAAFGVIATSTRFPDALAGSSLAFGVAPLLFTGTDGRLSGDTLGELRRTVPAGGTIYVLGGTAAIPAVVDTQLRDVGFTVQRLAGSGREETASVVADQVVSDADGFSPTVGGTVVLATGSNWPDAVTVGELGSFWGPPILLTPTDLLSPFTAEALRRLAPDRVLVAGGTVAITDAVVAEVEAITGAGSTTRLAGPTRFETAAQVSLFNRGLYGSQPPSVIVGVNLRRDRDAYAHVLAASMITGRFGGLFAAIEGDTGERVPQAVLDAVCGLDIPVVLAGGTDLISDAAASALAGAAVGTGCTATAPLDPGPIGPVPGDPGDPGPGDPGDPGPVDPGDTVDLVLGSIVADELTETVTDRGYQFAGIAGQGIRIRMYSPPGPDNFDTLVRLLGPDGQQLAFDDDGGEGTSSLLQVTLPVDGTYVIQASSFAQIGTGLYVLTVDSAPDFEGTGQITPDIPSQSIFVTGAPGTRVIIEMRALDDLADPLLLAAENGAVVDSDDDGGGFPHARLDTTIGATGRLEVVATVVQDFYGPFSLAVMAPDGGISFG